MLDRMVTLVATILLLAACSQDPPRRAEPAWLDDRPANALAYGADTLARFRDLAEGHHWRDPAWNRQGALELVHRGTGHAFVLVPAGRVVLPATTYCGHEERPEREVSVAAFLLGRSEVMRSTWFLGGGTGRPMPGTGSERPVTMVSWIEATAWCDRSRLRLPSDAEWERAWALRSAGRVGQDLPAWQPDDLGCYELLEDVSEWCVDRESTYDGPSPDDRPDSSLFGEWRRRRVTRGGAEGRVGRTEESRVERVGFRPAADLVPDRSRCPWVDVSGKAPFASPYYEREELTAFWPRIRDATARFSVPERSARLSTTLARKAVDDAARWIRRVLRDELLPEDLEERCVAFPRSWGDKDAVWCAGEVGLTPDGLAPPGALRWQAVVASGEIALTILEPYRKRGIELLESHGHRRDRRVEAWVAEVSTRALRLTPDQVRAAVEQGVAGEMRFHRPDWWPPTSWKTKYGWWSNGWTVTYDIPKYANTQYLPSLGREEWFRTVGE
jgi:hypothetical protein